MGDPSDPVKNCLFEVCCGPAGAEEQMTALLLADGVCSEKAEARRVSAWVYERFDLAERGTLTAFKKSIARVVKA